MDKLALGKKEVALVAEHTAYTTINVDTAVARGDDSSSSKSMTFLLCTMQAWNMPLLFHMPIIMK